MGQIKKRVIVKSLKTKFAQYIFFCLLASLVMSFALSNLFFWGQTAISGKYLQQLEKNKREIAVGDDFTMH